MRRIVNRMLCARCSGLPLGKCWDFLSDMAFLWKSQHCAPFAHVCPWSKFRMFWLRRFPKTSPKPKHDQIVPCYHDHLRPFPYLSMASLMVAWARNWRLGWKVYVARVPEMGFPEFFLFSWGNDWWPAMASMGFGVPYFRPHMLATSDWWRVASNPVPDFLWALGDHDHGNGFCQGLLRQRELVSTCAL